MSNQLGIQGEPWNEFEINLIVVRYLELYSRIARGEVVNKTEYYRDIANKLQVRTTSSIALKMANISSVMLGLGWPYMPGIRPMAHIQQKLIDYVSHAIGEFDSLDEAAIQLVQSVPYLGKVDISLSPKAPSILELSKSQLGSIAMKATRNYIELEERNSALGKAGEHAVLKFEERRLRNAGAIKLANRIEQVSMTRGDGAGYDIHSFEINGKDRLIEVKTTTGSDAVPFYISRNELDFSKSNSEYYHLSRVYDFPTSNSPRRNGRMFELSGNLEQSCVLNATSYEVMPRDFRVNK